MTLLTIEQKLHKNRRNIIYFCSQFSKIYLYGTGEVARSMYRYLLEEKIEVHGFFVSPGQKKEDYFFDRPVQELSRQCFAADMGIILAVGARLRAEVMQYLQENHIPLPNIYQQMLYRVHRGNMVDWSNRLPPLQETTTTAYSFFSHSTELETIGKQFGTDKCGQGHNYLQKYEFFLKAYRNLPITILELGVFQGASLNMWEEYFPHGKIIGVDFDQTCMRCSGGRREILIMDLSDKKNLERLQLLKPSVVIDDASHLWSHQILSLIMLFPVLPTGGVYILEDLETSFPSYRFMNFDDASICAYDFCAAVAEVVTSNEFLRTDNREVIFSLLHTEIEDIAQQTEMISFIQGSCILIKK